MYYLVESRNLETDEEIVNIQNHPQYSRDCKKFIIFGDCGNVNNCAIWAHGEYETNEDVEAAMLEIFGEPVFTPYRPPRTGCKILGCWDIESDVFEGFKSDPSEKFPSPDFLTIVNESLEPLARRLIPKDGFLYLIENTDET